MSKEINHVYGSEYSILLRFHFFLNLEIFKKRTKLKDFHCLKATQITAVSFKHKDRNID